MKKTKDLTKQELKIIAKIEKFWIKLLKILDNAKLGKTNYNDELANYMVNSVGDLIKYCQLVYAGEFKKASDYDMDSSVRDAIPEEIWDGVQNIVYPPNDKMTINEAFQDERLFRKKVSKNKKSYTEWKKEIIDLLVKHGYAVSVQKAKHYLFEADSVASADMSLKDNYKKGISPRKYIIKGYCDGFWFNPDSKTGMGLVK